MSLEDARGSTLDHVPRDAGGRWLPGRSANPNGRPPRMQACREAIEEARDPKKVGRMLAALYEAGIAGDVSASKTWLAYVAGPPPRDAGDLDPDEGGTPLPPLESNG